MSAMAEDGNGDRNSALRIVTRTGQDDLSSRLLQFRPTSEHLSDIFNGAAGHSADAG
jgi:hypothetical protein